MKKVLLIAVLLMAAPLYAANSVDFSLTDNKDGTGTLSYTVNADVNGISADPVGMGLNIDANVPVVGVTMIESFFDVYMDAAYTLDDEYDYGEGTPFAAQGEAGQIALSSSPTSFCLSIAGLGELAPATPPTGGPIDLCTIDLGAEGTVTIDENVLRGGVVPRGPDPNNVTNLPIETLITYDCIDSGHDDYDEWIDAGEPECWCYPAQCKGDADGLKEGVNPYSTGYYVGTDDINIMATAWQLDDDDLALVPNGACADFDHAKEGVNPYSTGYRVGTDDINIMAVYWQDKDLVADCSPGNVVP